MRQVPDIGVHEKGGERSSWRLVMGEDLVIILEVWGALTCPKLPSHRQALLQPKWLVRAGALREPPSAGQSPHPRKEPLSHTGPWPLAFLCTSEGSAHPSSCSWLTEASKLKKIKKI